MHALVRTHVADQDGSPGSRTARQLFVLRAREEETANERLPSTGNPSSVTSTDRQRAPMPVNDIAVFRIIRWYDVVVLSVIVLVALSVVVATGRTTPVEVVNAVAISSIVFGSIYLLVGLFEGTFRRIRSGARERFLEGIRRV